MTDIADATISPIAFSKRYSFSKEFRNWCHTKTLGDLELLLPVWEREELYEHCAVIASVIKAKEAAKTRKFHETTIKAGGS
jgi:hypothetical protein